MGIAQITLSFTATSFSIQFASAMKVVLAFFKQNFPYVTVSQVDLRFKWNSLCVSSYAHQYICIGFFYVHGLGFILEN